MIYFLQKKKRKGNKVIYMLYVSNGKIYLRVSNKYKEVNITKKDKDNFFVKANDKSFEESELGTLAEISLVKAYDLLNKKDNPSKIQ